MLKRYSILWFVIITVALSFAVYFIPLPDGSRTLLVPVLLVFVPAIVCIPLALVTEGKDGIRQLFSTASGGVKWLLIGILVGGLMRVAVLLAGRLFGMPINADLSVPGTWFIVFAPIPLAYFEEIGWRRFALDRLLKSHSPFAASLLLGLPWAVIHLIILLPGMMSVGAPAFPQTIVLVSLGIVLTWAYVRSGGSVLSVTLLHGVQNGLTVLNRGLPIGEVTWLMFWVYLVLAIIVIAADRHMFFTKSTAT